MNPIPTWPLAPKALELAAAAGKERRFGFALRMA
jgi:hypothetical protein